MRRQNGRTACIRCSTISVIRPLNFSFILVSFSLKSFSANLRKTFRFSDTFQPIRKQYEHVPNSGQHDVIS